MEPFKEALVADGIPYASFRVDVGEIRVAAPAPGLPVTVPKKNAQPVLSTLAVADAPEGSDAV